MPISLIAEKLIESAGWVIIASIFTTGYLILLQQRKKYDTALEATQTDIVMMSFISGLMVYGFTLFMIAPLTIFSNSFENILAINAAFSVLLAFLGLYTAGEIIISESGDSFLRNVMEYCVRAWIVFLVFIVPLGIITGLLEPINDNLSRIESITYTTTLPALSLLMGQAHNKIMAVFFDKNH